MLFRAAYGRRRRRRGVRVLHKPYAILALTHPVSRSEEITLQPTTTIYPSTRDQQQYQLKYVRRSRVRSVCVHSFVRSFVQPLSVSIYLARSRAYSLALSCAFVCVPRIGGKLDHIP